MVITEKQALKIKKIMDALYKYRKKHRISELRPFYGNEDYRIFYNEATTTLLKRSVISFAYLKDFYIDNRRYQTNLNYSQFLSFMKENSSFYYYTKDVGRDTEIQFLNFEEYKSLENVISKITELSLKSKLTNKEIISNFKYSEIAYLYRYENLFINEFKSFLENLENS